MDPVAHIEFFLEDGTWRFEAEFASLSPAQTQQGWDILRTFAPYFGSDVSISGTKGEA